jgi:uncharacterized membrane protein YhaH (DUF805 family)
MGPLTAISTAVAKIFNFSGRAGRSEYWWYFLLYLVVFSICGFLDGAMVVALAEQQGEAAITSLGIFDFKTVIAAVFLMPPMISLTVRRLHDAGFSGFWILIYLVPLGGFALLVLHALPSTGRTTAHGAPAARPTTDPSGKSVPVDAHKRAMQGYAMLYEKDKVPTAETQAARKAEIAEYYRTQVLKSSPTA